MQLLASSKPFLAQPFYSILTKRAPLGNPKGLPMLSVTLGEVLCHFRFACLVSWTIEKATDNLRTICVLDHGDTCKFTFLQYLPTEKRKK